MMISPPLGRRRVSGRTARIQQALRRRRRCCPSASSNRSGATKRKRASMKPAHALHMILEGFDQRRLQIRRNGQRSRAWSASAASCRKRWRGRSPATPSVSSPLGDAAWLLLPASGAGADRAGWSRRSFRAGQRRSRLVRAGDAGCLRGGRIAGCFTGAAQRSADGIGRDAAQALPHKRSPPSTTTSAAGRAARLQRAAGGRGDAAGRSTQRVLCRHGALRDETPAKSRHDLPGCCHRRPARPDHGDGRSGSRLAISTCERRCWRR